MNDCVLCMKFFGDSTNCSRMIFALLLLKHYSYLLVSVVYKNIYRNVFDHVIL